MIAALLIASLMAAPQFGGQVVTTEQLQADFEHAVPCREVDGRKVWKGELAYFIQSYVYNDEGAETTSEGADAVMPSDNTADTMREFEEACAHER
ncbi:hypothetical protein MRS76_18700 [Rhizobiaceae bacterium n13]|uniref:Uncharacterized protein n=1 Tax=Ferirhizobium litorale TaxID=2927786 RepID=A0AAE3U458_9HYPH|nr:hypothetical protein [Fererhizobium litorale]MDI7863980.1 hypothetical protein [Fererhizobium litorale]MDI7924537.1 hypothetical protein [Fererhizobium litorale]